MTAPNPWPHPWLHPWPDPRARAALRHLFDAAVAAADPRVMLAAHLPAPPRSGRVVVVGAGKSAAVMAAAVEDAWPDIPLSGVVVTRYGHAVPTRHVAVLEAAHPEPDAAGEAAARRILAAVDGLGPADLVLALISGGGSALLTLPAPGLTLADKRAVNRALLGCGATIHEMNVLRRHLSAIKGGRLAAAAHPARVLTLAISDVSGDQPVVIASGPTVEDPSTFADAREVVARYRLALPAAVTAHLATAAPEAESRKPGDPRLAGHDYRLIATPMLALRAMAQAARALGLAPLILGDALEGEAHALGTALAGMALSVRAHGHPVPPPCVLLSGGETTVPLHPSRGRGGRNTTCLGGLLLGLAGAPGIWAMAADTDGLDGAADAAGAIATPDSLQRARSLGLDPRTMLDAQDSAALFGALGDLIVTGPTLTNVNDVRAVLVT